jgi:hypothetical protein
VGHISYQHMFFTDDGLDLPRFRGRFPVFFDWISVFDLSSSTLIPQGSLTPQAREALHSVGSQLSRG